MVSGAMGGKVALVTGAGSGIGRAIALAFAKEGATVTVADVDPRGGEETVSEVKNLGARGLFVKCDVSKKADIKALVEGTIKEFGRLDFACNNAGTHHLEPESFTEIEEESWDRIMAINLKGVFLCMQCEVQQMRKQGSGVIVNVASLAGIVAEPGGYCYTASKHGVMGLTKVAAFEYARLGIRINAVCPGVVETPMSQKLPDETRQMLLGMHPVGRFGKPEEIAGAVMWLCSDLAGFVIGSGIVLDGGISTI
ncbi:MAG: glucose 1-dehydrogenase [Deltaproteobacteria bacterium]|nr:glucose 1-dehydrogenase [Deltaproteobacteria bacterium]